MQPGKNPNSDVHRIIFNLKVSHQQKNKTKIMPNFKMTNRSFSSDLKVPKVDTSDRFKKKCNLVETNKSNVFRTTTAPTYKVSLTEKSSRVMPRKIYLEPKSLDEFISDASIEQPKLKFDSENLEPILLKNKMKKHRNLLSYNILHLQKKYNFSRFQLHNLYSIFHTLLRDSKNSLQKFKKSFQVIFNMNKISIRPQTLNKIFQEQTKIDFQSFIAMYSQIDKAIFKQNIIDYIQILFDGIYDKKRIRHSQIVRILRNRITQKEALDIVKILYDNLDRYEEQTINIDEVYHLCHSCQIFAKKMYRLYTNECSQ